MQGVQDTACLFPACFGVRTTQLLESESPLFCGCSQRHSQDQCLGEVVGRKPPGATVSTVLSSSLELIPRSFKPKGTGGTTVKIVLKEKHKKGKRWRGQAVCVCLKGLLQSLEFFRESDSAAGFPQQVLLPTLPHPASTRYLSPHACSLLTAQIYYFPKWVGRRLVLGMFRRSGTWEGRSSAGKLHMDLPGQCHRRIGYSSLQQCASAGSDPVLSQVFLLEERVGK